MKRSIAILTLMLASSAALSSALAAPITYRIVPRFPGGPVVLTGTLTTDGTIGSLAAADILAWSFLLQDTQDSRSSMLSSATGTVTVVGPSLVASATDLTFMFRDTMQYSTHFDGTSGPPNPLTYWLLQTRAAANVPNVDPGSGAENISSATGYNDNMFRTDREVIGLALPSSVPEPPPLALLGTGLVLLTVGRFRRRHRMASGR